MSRKWLIIPALAFSLFAITAIEKLPIGATHPIGPAASWPFDDGTDPTIDVAHGANGALGTAPGADASDPTFSTTDIAPRVGNVRSLGFDGTNDFVRVANVANLEPANVSVSMWVKSLSPGGGERT